ncbi:MAG TPA: Ig-like domain repeat protein, partial [Pirellulales bacterium]|nr:Ig-like domain repeat protein [Pirellulales bacterium]
TLTATVSPNSGTVTPGGSVDFVDTTTGVDLGTAALSSSGKGTVSVADLPVGTDAIQANYLGATGFKASSATNSVSINQSVIVLNATASAALGLSGNASLKFAAGLGLVEVDSSSSTALTVSGNAQVNAGTGLVQVVGGDSVSGNGKVSPKPATGAKVALADPLANLAAPAGGASLGAVSVSGNSSKTINPGAYTQISVSGNAKLTLNPGTYIITGGGFSVSGNASVSGNGVMIYNAGSAFPNPGGSYGYINLSGNGTISLTAETTGAFAGILIIQPRANTQALTFSGNALGGMAGAVYAPSAAASISGNASLNLPLVVNTLALSGSAVFNDVAAQPSAGSGATVFTPDQIRTAYGLDNVSSDGAGQTIAIVDAYDDPAIFDALDTFDSQFGLSGSGPNLNQQYGPASSFLTVLNESGQSAPLPATDPTGAGNDNWEVEEALDVEWAHATAPGARILLVEADSQSIGDLMSAVGEAAGLPGVSVVSMSWGFTEGQTVLAADESLYDGYLTTPAGHQGVTFVASTGDYGAANPEYPAFSPNVVAVGGTSLILNSDNTYNSETGWGSLDTGSGVFYGGGGGISLYEPEPAYQTGAQTLGNRTTPDVSFVADPGTGAWIADPYNLDPSNPWEVVGGTSLSAPAWAGLIVIANQARVAAGGATLGSATPNEAQDALYSVPLSDYHDITSGSNGYAAGAGYDLVTGLGTPVADKLVPDLAAFTTADPVVVESSPLTAASAVPTQSNAVLGPANALPIFAAELVMSGTPAGQLTAAAGEALGSTRMNANLDAPTVASAASVGAVSGNVDSFQAAPRWALDEWDAVLAAMADTEEGDTGLPTPIDLMAWSAASGPALAAQTGPWGEGVKSSFEDVELLDTFAQARSAGADGLSARVRTSVAQAARQVPAAIADAVFGQQFE